MRAVWGILAVTGVLLAGTNARAQMPVTTPDTTPNTQADPSIQKTLETCFKCHGEGGVSRIPSRPTIAGQSADYVASQLHSFRRAALTMKPSIASRSRIDPIMSHMADDLGEGQINALAQVISKLSCDGDVPKDTGLKPLVMPKVGTRCVACHGVGGVTSQPGIPNLAGQRRAYLRRELLLIRETAWGATPRENESWRSHPIMESEAARISISDVDALARYYASLDCRGKQRATQ